LYVTEPTADQPAAVERAVTLAENNQSKLAIIDVYAPVAGDYRPDTTDYRRKALESQITPYWKRLEIRLDVMLGPLFLEAVRAALRNRHDLVIKTAEESNFLNDSAHEQLGRRCL
jgi:hypothetical protein